MARDLSRAVMPNDDPPSAGEGLFRDMVERACDLVFRLDSRYRFTYSNAAAERLLGRPPIDLLGTSLLDLVPSEHRGTVRNALDSLVVSESRPTQIEFPVEHPDGTRIWLGQVTQLVSGPGREAELQAEARDVTDERSVREALARSEAQLRAMVECLGEGLMVVDSEERVLYVNPAFEIITGYSAADLVGNRAFDLMGYDEPHPEGARGEWNGELAERREMRIRHREGHWIDVRVISTPLRDGGDLPFALLAAVDITDQKRAERKREESAAFFRQIAESVGETFWISTADLHTPLYVSPAFEHVIGEPPQDFVARGEPFLSLVHPDDREMFREATALPGVIENGFDVEVRVVRPDGEVRWIHNRGFAVRDPNGEVYRLAGVAEDVTERRAVRDAIHRSEASYRSLYNSLTDLVYIQDLEGRFLNVNDAVVEAYGYSREELIGQTPQVLADPERFEGVQLAERLRLAAQGEPQRFEFWGRRRDGSVFPKEVVLTRTEYFGQDSVMAVGRDISDRLRAQTESDRLAALSRENPNPVLECDEDGRPLHANPAATAVAAELGLASVAELLPPNHEDLVQRALHRDDGFHGVEVTLGGRIFEWTYRPHVASGVVHLFANDVTGRRMMEEQLRHDALHDALTELPNRALFMERLEHAVQRARRREDYRFAVLFLDLDRFKLINDSLGHHIGDELLVAVAERLRGCVRGEDTVSRLGGDEFTVLVESVGDTADATRVADRILEALAEPLHLEGVELVMTSSIGIALGGSPNDSPPELLRNADVAMYRAKTLGPGRYALFDRSMHVPAMERLHVEAELRAAVERRELTLHFQPVLALPTRAVSSVEALLRWRHPERGLLLPDDFLSIAEEAGTVRQLGSWVLHEGSRCLAEWRDRHGPVAPATVAVNVSRRQLSDELLHQADAALRDSGLPPEALCLEISEGALVANVEVAVVLLQRLKELGVRLCVDDFGTGYSSLSNLHRFPLDEVKIDASIIARMLDRSGTRQLVGTMITLAHGLGARAIAKGVETAEQLEALRELGVDHVQGRFLAPPLPPAELDDHLAGIRHGGAGGHDGGP